MEANRHALASIGGRAPRLGRMPLPAAILGTLVLILSASRPLLAQDGSPPARTSLQEAVEKLKKEIEALRVEVDKLKAQEPAATQEDVQELEKEIKRLKERLGADEPGGTRLLITGYGFAGFVDEQRGPSSFDAGFNPIFLWSLSDRIFVEAEIELELEDDEVKVDLEYVDLVYFLNDYVAVGAGQFLAPLGNFSERFHPAWINKFPDAPLAFGHDGLAPTSLLGLQLRGAIPISPTKLTYAFTVSNGPRLNPGEPGDPVEAGMLLFDNLEDVRHGKAVGGRLGFLPIPELEVSYSVIFADVSMPDDDLKDVSATLHSIDLNYVRDTDFLKGTIDVKIQWIWSSVERTTYDRSGTLGFGPISFSNRRNGGYVQFAYRPSKIEWGFLKNLEAVVRYDAVDLPRSAPTNVDETRWTIGLDYWISPSMVVKAAYRFDDRDDPAGLEEDRDAVLVQFALGF